MITLKLILPKNLITLIRKVIDIEQFQYTKLTENHELTVKNIIPFSLLNIRTISSRMFMNNENWIMHYRV